MNINHPIRVGTSLAVAVAVGYTACSAVFWLWPETAVTFMNALFHGLDFRKLQGATSFAFGSFIYAVSVMTLWAFVLGTAYSWLKTRFGVTKR